MGGKSRQAQRTKNNAKPSNSGRSAEYLSNNMPHFSGFTGRKETGFIFPLMATEDIELSIDANFQVVLKKMNKKDNTTKIKALQEFADLVKNSDAEVIKTILPYWPRLYNSLATDSENKVREATHVAHNEVVQKVKRNLAPHLKSIIASWFTSQYDTYPPAATAATMSFKNAFPEKKIEEVIVFCNKEILDYIHDNLFIHTTQTVSNPKHNTPEELQDKYERVLISSLLGYSLYLKKIPKDKIEEMADINRKIINNNKFWKYSKHNLIIVRAAWFKVLIALFEKAPFLLEKDEGHVVSYILGSIDENDPVVLPLVWQNVLLTISSIKEWWTKVNIDKLMLPKLWKVLKNGGQGNAAVIFPNLLPLLSNMMSIIDVDTFYTNFFTNLCLGLKQKTVIASKSESTAISISLLECIRYVIMKNEENTTLCEKVIKSFLIPTIHWCLTETQCCYKTIFNQTASLAQYWSRNNLNGNSNYIRYLTYFFDNINSLFDGILLDLDYSNSERILCVSEKQVEFFKIMKHTPKIKKGLKVKFDSNKETVEGNHISCSLEQLNEFYINTLTGVVLRTCETYVKIIDDKKLKELLDHLAVLIQEFDSISFFDHMSKKMAKDQESDILIIYENLLRNWLECENLWCKSLIHIIFLTFKHLDDGKKGIVLDSLNMITNEGCLGWCLEEALSHQYNKDPLIRKWLIGDKVSNFLVDIVEKEINDCCPPDFSVLFKLAITENDDEELYVSKEAISKVLDKLIHALLHPNDHLTTIDTCASLASYLSAIVYTKNYLLTFTDELLLSLMKLFCHTGIDIEYLSSDTIWEVQTAWQDALTVLSSNLPRTDLEMTVDKVVSFIQESFVSDNLEDEKLEKLIDVLINLCRAIYKATPLEMSNILSKLFDHDFILDNRNLVTELCKSAEYLNGKLASCYNEIKIESDINVESRELLHFFTWMYVRVSVLTANVEDTTADDEEEEEDNQVAEIWSILDSRMCWISQTLYDLELARCFLENYKTVQSSEIIQQYTEKAYSSCSVLMKRFVDDDKNALNFLIQSMVFSESWMWIRTFYTLQTDLLNEDPIDAYANLVKNATIENNLAVIQATQVFSKHLDYDYVTHIFDNVGRIIVLRCLAECQEIDVQIAEVMSTIETFKNDILKINLQSSNLDWQSYQIILEIVRLFNELIRTQFNSLSRGRLDLIIISATEWLQGLTQTHKTEKGKAMFIAVTKLYQSINDKINEMRQPDRKVALVKEWDDLFVEGAQNNLAKIWLNLAEYFRVLKHSLPIKELPVMYRFASMTECFDHQLIFKQTEDKPMWFKLLKESCTLFSSASTTLQLAGYKTLLSLVPVLVNIDSEAVDSNTPNKDGLLFEMFKRVCLLMQDIVSTMLSDLKLGEDSCHVQPFTDSYNYTLAYLLIWDIMLCLCEEASIELKFQYADWLRQEDILKSLLDNLFRLMPIEVLHHAESKKLYHPEWFSSRVEFVAEKVCTSAELEHMVCWIYYSTLLQLPALVRQWWSRVEIRIAQIVERITSAYVSPILINREMEDITQHEKKFKNMTIKVLPTVREVIAVYTVDESQMELIITLPTNYPLAGPDVHCNRQISGTSFKQWVMQFRKCVLYQNGRIWDGLSLWNNNLDKKFDGVEECYICFAVLHPGTYQLPKLSCQTCKKKFHSACLYKWFSTSNKSSCPICRNLF